MPTAQLLPAITLTVAAASFITAATAGLRAMGVARRSLRAQLTGSAAYVIGGATGAVVAGAVGASWGVTAAQVLRRAGVVASASIGTGRPPRCAGGGQVTATTAVPRLTLGLPVYNGETLSCRVSGRPLGADLHRLRADHFRQRLHRSDRRDRPRSTRPKIPAYGTSITRSEPRLDVQSQLRGRSRPAASSSSGCQTTTSTRQTCSQRCIDALDSHPRDRPGACLDGVHRRRGRDHRRDRLCADHRCPRSRRTLPERAVHRWRRRLLRRDPDVGSATRSAPFGSYHWADRTFVAELALHGPFYNVPEFLYFRRDHPTRATRVGRTTSGAVASTLDPKRANRWRHPVARLLGEYLLGV